MVDRYTTSSFSDTKSSVYCSPVQDNIGFLKQSTVYLICYYCNGSLPLLVRYRDMPRQSVNTGTSGLVACVARATVTGEQTSLLGRLCGLLRYLSGTVAHPGRLGPPPVVRSPWVDFYYADRYIIGLGCLGRLPLLWCMCSSCSHPVFVGSRF